MTRNGRRSLWKLWHPHQRLWNWDLIGIVKKRVPIAPINKALARGIILADTSLLFLRALSRRIFRVGPRKLFAKAKIPSDLTLFYFDLGTHEDGKELAHMVNQVLPRRGGNFKAYGFEANSDSYQQAKTKFAGKQNVKMVHAALCAEDPSSGKIRLYKMSGGMGDSIYRPTDSYEEVDATRFTTWLSDNRIVLDHNICLLRMNIEGAEYDVIKDLVDAGMANNIDGYYGMWDDLSKIDVDRDDEFRAFLSRNRISPCTFNGRDMNLPLRQKCIDYDIDTSILTKLKKLGRR